MKTIFWIMFGPAICLIGTCLAIWLWPITIIMIAYYWGQSYRSIDKQEEVINEALPK